MKRGALLVAVALAALWIPRAARSGPADTLRIGGYYRSAGNAESITIVMLSPGIYRAESEGWTGVGLFDGSHYWGVFTKGRKGGAQTTGTHEGTVRRDGSVLVHGEITRGAGMRFDDVWTPDPLDKSPQPPAGPVDAPPGYGGLPSPGGYPYVEAIPVAITRVAPLKPPCMDQGVQGTVVVQALVGRDGRVKDARVLRSIPCLDEAAIEAVRRWVFRPAMTMGSPVEVWASVPVKFTLH